MKYSNQDFGSEDFKRSRELLVNIPDDDKNIGIAIIKIKKKL